MKRIIPVLLSLLLFLACAKTNPAEIGAQATQNPGPIVIETEAPSEPLPAQTEPEQPTPEPEQPTPEPEPPTPEPDPTPYAPDLSALPIQYIVDWQQKEATMFTFDIDYDGVAETISYRLDDDIDVTYLFVDEEKIVFSRSSDLNRVILTDLDPETPWVNLLVVIDWGSDDYFTTEVHPENGALQTGVEREFVALSNDGRLISYERTDLLGTKDGVRYVHGEKLEPDSEWLEVWVPSEEELKTHRKDLIEGGTLLHTKRAVNCRIDGRPDTIKKGSYVYMTRYHESGMLVEVKTEDGRTALIAVDCDPEGSRYLIGGRSQDKVFDNIFYAD